MLYKLASRKGPDGRPPPARYFSIDRVFRNESVDATHLAEFHQVEGVIADYNLTLGGLMEVSCSRLDRPFVQFKFSHGRLSVFVLVYGHLLRQDGHHGPQIQASL